MLFSKRYADSSDADLVTWLAQGDERAFREVLVRHQGPVYRFAVRMLEDSYEAEDIAQETFLRLFRSADRYRPEASLRAYLLAIARNLCIDRMRKKSPELMEQPPELTTRETPLDSMVRSQTMDRLLGAVSNLPENQRSAVLLRHDQGLRYNEIANVMGVSVSAVESLLVRARRTLRKQLSPDG